MAKHGKRSKECLATAHTNLQDLFGSVILDFDHSVIDGHRTPEEQFELFKRGRRLESGVWVIQNRLQVVTFKDGYKRLSGHNYLPSRALDVTPHPIRWGDTDRMYYFAGVVMERARAMGLKVRWLGDADGDTVVSDESFVDLPHFEVVIRARA